MTLKIITSLADLLFKAKTEEPYRELLIRSTRDLLNLEYGVLSYEKALEELSKYIEGHTDCSFTVKEINRELQRMNDEANSVMYMMKNRKFEPNRNGDIYFNRPAMSFSGGTYTEYANEYARRRQENINRQTVEITHGTDYDIFTRTGINPQTGEPISVQVSARHDLPPDSRIEVERELQRQFDYRIEEIVRNRRSHIENQQAYHGDYYDDEPCSNENPCSVCRELADEHHRV